jgi:L,D-transpeptidase catalytic domain
MSANRPAEPAARHQQGLTVTVIVVLLLAAAAALIFGRDATPQMPAVPHNSASQIPVDTSPPIPVPFVSAQQLAKLPATTTDATIAAAPRDTRRSDDTAGVVVHNRQPVAVFATAGGRPFARLPVTQLGADTWLPVIGQQSGWVQVLLPSRPNGSMGWLSTDQLSLARSNDEIRIHLAANRLQLVRSGRITGSWTVSTGTHRTPTPTGRTFLLAVIRDPQQTFSPLIYALGTHSAALDTYAGGPGTVGIHTWPTASTPRASHGCIRVPAGALRAIAQVPLGSLIRIDQ